MNLFPGFLYLIDMQEDKLLGKRVDYPKSYCPDILVAVPRRLNREIYRIEKADELFCGYDSWHAYETSFLLGNGMPVIGILKIVYPATSECIVESKSLKLYLASFNMEKLGTSRPEAIAAFVRTVEKDLGVLLETEVQAGFFESIPATEPFDFEEYRTLEEIVAPGNMTFSVYREDPALLTESICEVPGELKVCSHLLKSNCKITNQPDWGSVYIRIRAKRLPGKEALLKYIVSLRNENHFHEEICEMMFKRLTDLFQPEVLSVCCLYTRRGGIDICPARANRPEFLPRHLPNPGILTRKGFRQ